MPIYKGNTPIVGIYKGSTEIVRRYKGADLIYESAKWLPYSFSPFIMTTLPQTIDGLNVKDAQKIASLKGNSVAWNQLVKNGNFESAQGWYTIGSSGSISVANNIAKVTKTSNAQIFLYRANADYPALTTHKYLHTALVRTSNNASLRFACGNSYMQLQSITANTWTRISFIASPTRFGGFFSDIQDENTLPIDGYFETREYNIFDLTLMFGAGSEPTSVLEFNKLFPNAYYAYDAGTLKSSQASALKTTGYNQSSVDRTQGTLVGGDYSNNNAQNFSEGEYYLGISANDYINRNPVLNFSKTETSVTFTTSVTSYGVALPVRVIAGKTYNLEMTISDGMAYRYISWYDESGRFISYNSGTDATQYTAPSNAYWGVILLRPSSSSSSVAVTYSNICLHLTGKTGYEPYWSETYQLPNIVLRSAGSVSDELSPDGTLTRRIGVVDLGTLNWIYLSNYQIFLATGLQSILIKPSNNSLTNYSQLLDSYGYYINRQSQSDQFVSDPKNISVSISASGNLQLRNTSYTDATAFKTAMSGVYLYYESATPTTEQSTAFQEQTKIDPYGTMEMATDIPQGMDSKLKCK